MIDDHKYIRSINENNPNVVIKREGRNRTYKYNRRIKKIITEEMILDAVKNTNSNMHASRYLGISLQLWKKISSRINDETTGLNLYALHKNQGDKTGKKLKKTKGGFTDVDIITGNWPQNYKITDIYRYLRVNKIFPEECGICGYHDKRLWDDKIPLKLNFKDGNRNNKMLTNLEFICHNCFFVIGGRTVQVFDLYNNDDNMTIGELKELVLRKSNFY